MKITYRSPKIFKNGGIWLHIWNKWYLIYRVSDKRLDSFK